MPILDIQRGNKEGKRKMLMKKGRPKENKKIYLFSFWDLLAREEGKGKIQKIV